jgi:hypothetical protein
MIGDVEDALGGVTFLGNWLAGVLNAEQIDEMQRTHRSLLPQPDLNEVAQ